MPIADLLPLATRLPSDVWTLAVLLLAAPCFEEVIFRGGLQQHLQQRWQDARGALRAQGATTLAFGLAHAVVRGWALGLAVLLPAWLIGHLYRRHARLWPCVAVHALFNLTWLATAGILLPSA